MDAKRSFSYILFMHLHVLAVAFLRLFKEAVAHAYASSYPADTTSNASGRKRAFLREAAAPASYDDYHLGDSAEELLLMLLALRRCGSRWNEETEAMWWDGLLLRPPRTRARAERILAQRRRGSRRTPLRRAQARRRTRSAFSLGPCLRQKW